MENKIQINLSDGTLISLMRKSEAFECLSKLAETDSKVMRNFELAFQAYANFSKNHLNWKDAWSAFQAYSMGDARDQIIHILKHDSGQNVIRFGDDRNLNAYDLVPTKSSRPIRVYDTGVVTQGDDLLGPAAYLLYLQQSSSPRDTLAS